jgi:hypothetical protein
VVHPLEALRAAGGNQQGLATRQQLLDAGLSPKRLHVAVAAGVLTRVQRGVYAGQPIGVPERHLLSGGRVDDDYVRRVRATVLALGDGAVVSRRTAAVLWGFDLVAEPQQVEVDVPQQTRGRTLQGADVQRRDAASCRLSLPAGTAPLRVATALATVVTCALVLPTDQAVAVADSALRCRRVSLGELRVARDARRGQPGASALARAVRLVDPRCGSVLESMLRVLLARHGLPPPYSQHVLRRGDGSFLGRVDFCWPDRRLVVEADGRRWHDPSDVRDADRRRSNDLEMHGWGLLRFTWADVVHDPDYVVETVRAALMRRGVA